MKDYQLRFIVAQIWTAAAMITRSPLAFVMCMVFATYNIYKLWKSTEELEP